MKILSAWKKESWIVPDTSMERIKFMRVWLTLRMVSLLAPSVIERLKVSIWW